MPEVSFANLFLVLAVALAIPLALGLAPRLRIPAAVVEIVAGIVIGPAGLGLVERDEVVRVMAVLGLAFLLFLGGTEIELGRLRGPLLGRSLGAFAVSAVLGIVVGLGLSATGLVGDPLLVAIILLATSLGVVVPVLRDARASGSVVGQTVIAGATVADFGAVVLLSVFFSRGDGGSGVERLVVLLGIALTALVIAAAVLRAEHVRRLSTALASLQDTTAQVRVRAAVLLLVGLVVLAEGLGLELILGAFLAGVVVTAVDRDEAGTHPLFRVKLEAIGFGLFIPVFFVASGLAIDLGGLLARPSDLALVPLFLGSLLVVRGLPAVLYRPAIGGRPALAAGLLQATSLPFIVAASQIGLELGALSASVAAALIGAGLLSVLLFPAVAVALLAEGDRVAAAVAAGADAVAAPASEVAATAAMPEAM